MPEYRFPSGGQFHQGQVIVRWNLEEMPPPIIPIGGEIDDYDGSRWVVERIVFHPWNESSRWNQINYAVKLYLPVKEPK